MKRIINMQDHNCWGNCVDWFNWDTREVVGHLPTIPDIGDELRSKMDSGKIARFRIESVRQQTDPNDMFFATVSDIGYLGE